MGISTILSTIYIDNAKISDKILFITNKEFK